MSESSALVLPPGLVTGEAVVLELRPASFATRALALVVDLVVLALAALVLAWVAALATDGLDEAGAAAVGLVAAVGLIVGVPATVETLSRGRSLGKLAAGLRVVRDDGGPIRARHALVRALLGVLEIWATAGSVAVISSLANPRGKRLGDLLAGTYVVRDRAAALPPPPAMPPELAAWAARADIGRVPDPVALAARQFLVRAPALHRASRHQLAVDLAARVARVVAPAPPGTVDPERYLAAVLAERRRRELWRLAALEQARRARAGRRASTNVLAPASSRLVGGEDVRSPGGG